MDSWLPMKGLRRLEPKEAEIEMAVSHYFAAQNFFVWKNPSSGYYDASKRCFRRHTSPFAINGAPDLIIVHNGRFVGIECKTRLGRLTDAQAQFKERLEHSGGLYFICRSLDDAKVISLAIK